MIDYKVIRERVLTSKRPEYCEVSDKQWRDVLIGLEEVFSNADPEPHHTGVRIPSASASQANRADRGG